MIGRMYTVATSGIAVTTSKTLVEVSAASDSVLLVERATIGQTTFDTSENLGAAIKRIATTGTGTSTTARPFDVGTVALGTTPKTNDTIEPTYGVTLYTNGFNVLSGFLWTPANDDEVFGCSPSGLMGLFLDTAPSGSMTMSFGCTIREIG